MLKRNLILGSAASFALACVAAAPSYAQSLPRYSTPAEMAQTRALNEQQASESGPIATIPGTVVASDGIATANYDSALAAQSAAQSQYDSQFNDYQQKRSAYDQQRQDYRRKLNAYNAQTNAYLEESR